MEKRVRELGILMKIIFEAEEDEEEDFIEEQQDLTENNMHGSDDIDSPNSGYVIASSCGL